MRYVDLALETASPEAADAEWVREWLMGGHDLFNPLDGWYAHLDRSGGGAEPALQRLDLLHGNDAALGLRDDDWASRDLDMAELAEAIASMPGWGDASALRVADLVSAKSADERDLCESFDCLGDGWHQARLGVNPELVCNVFLTRPDERTWASVALDGLSEDGPWWKNLGDVVLWDGVEPASFDSRIAEWAAGLMVAAEASLALGGLLFHDDLGLADRQLTERRSGRAWHL